MDDTPPAGHGATTQDLRLALTRISAEARALHQAVQAKASRAADTPDKALRRWAQRQAMAPAETRSVDEIEAAEVARMEAWSCKLHQAALTGRKLDRPPPEPKPSPAVKAMKRWAERQARKAGESRSVGEIITGVLVAYSSGTLSKSKTPKRLADLEAEPERGVLLAAREDEGLVLDADADDPAAGQVDRQLAYASGELRAAGVGPAWQAAGRGRRGMM